MPMQTPLPSPPTVTAIHDIPQHLIAPNDPLEGSSEVGVLLKAMQHIPPPPTARGACSCMRVSGEPLLTVLGEFRK